MTGLWLFLAGLYSLFGQVLLSRELLVSFSGNELPVIMGLGVLLLFSSFGLFSCRGASAARVRAMLAASAPAIFLLLLLASLLRLLFHATRGMLLPFHEQLLSMFIVLAPFGFLSGRLFGEISLLYIEEGGSIGNAYALDTLGALAGGVLSASLIRFGVSQGTAVCLLCAIVLSSSMLRKGLLKNLPAVAVFMLVLAIQPAVGKAVFEIARKEEPHLKEVQETPFGRLSVSTDGEQTAFFLNGSLLSENQSTSAEELVHLPALFCGKPRQILLIGGSVEGLAAEAAKHGPSKIDILEPCREFAGLPARYLPETQVQNKKVLINDLYEDGRKFLSGSGTYDLIIISAVEPASLSESRYFTEGFFRTVSSRLNPGGVFAFRIKGSENLWTGSLTQRNGSVLKPLYGIFGAVVVIPQGLTLVIASNSKAPPLSVIEKRWKERGIEARLVSPSYFEYLLTNERRGRTEDLVRNGMYAKTTEDRAAAYPLTMVVELSRHFRRLGEFTGTIKTGLAAAAVLFFFLFASLMVWVWKGGPGTRYVPLVFLSGLWGMIYECALLVAYQVRNGALYNDIGILTALFMAGLSLGAVLQSRARCFSGRTREAAHISALILFSVSSPLIIGRFGSSLAAMCGLALTAGLFAGGLFGFAAERSGRDSAVSLKKLYGADLIGGAVGSIVGALVLLPFLGISSTLFFTPLLFVPSLVTGARKDG